MKRFRFTLLIAAGIFLSGCGQKPAMQDSSGTETTTVTSVQETETTEPQQTDDAPDANDLSFENSYAARLCDLIDRRHFSVTLVQSYQDVVIGTSLIEADGDTVHLKNTGEPDEQYAILDSEDYFFGDSGAYTLRKNGDWATLPYDNNPFSAAQDPDNRKLEAMFFNAGCSPRTEMTLVSRTYDGDTVTETYDTDTGIGTVWMTFDRNTGAYLSGGYKDSVQTVSAMTEETAGIALPPALEALQ